MTRMSMESYGQTKQVEQSNKRLTFKESQSKEMGGGVKTD